jgi:hypothetical protein
MEVEEEEEEEEQGEVQEEGKEGMCLWWEGGTWRWWGEG